VDKNAIRNNIAGIYVRGKIRIQNSKNHVNTKRTQGKCPTVGKIRKTLPKKEKMEHSMKTNVSAPRGV
jgi:hypothetical protein